jgi:hypothetical protein
VQHAAEKFIPALIPGDGRPYRSGRTSAKERWMPRARRSNKKTALNIAAESLGRSRHRRVTALIFAIKARAVTNGD